MQLRTVVAALFLFFLSVSAHAQDARVVATCGTLPQAYAAGSTQQPTVDVNGKLCLNPGFIVTACTSWTPTDQSGAALTFTAVNAQYCQYGNIVFAYGTLTYPSTADGSVGKISLPVAVPNQSYAVVTGTVTNSGGNNVLKTIQNTSTATFSTLTAGASTLNSSLSTKTINFFIAYPAS